MQNSTVKQHFPTHIKMSSVARWSTEIPSSAPKGWVILVQDRHSLNNHIEKVTKAAEHLNEIGLATLTVDLAGAGNPQQAAYAWVEQTRDQLIRAAEWLQTQAEWNKLPINYVGSGRGAAAAWRASLVTDVQSVITWNAQPEFAWQALSKVTVPTLLLVDEHEQYAGKFANRLVHWQLRANSRLMLVPAGVPALETYLPEWFEQLQPTRPHQAARLSAPKQQKDKKSSPLSPKAIQGALVLALGLLAPTLATPTAHAAPLLRRHHPVPHPVAQNGGPSATSVGVADGLNGLTTNDKIPGQQEAGPNLPGPQDTNNNGIPDFLEPAGSGALDKTAQPHPPNHKLFLPLVGR